MMLLERLDRLPSPAAVVLALAGFAGVAALDVASGPHVRLTALYLLPLGLLAWRAGPLAGLLLAGASGALWLWLARLEWPGLDRTTVTWNAAVQASVMLLFAALVAALRQRLDAEGRLARTDPLTGLLNGRAFAERATLELERARRGGRPLTLAYLDLDGFKAVNDRLGHVAGDHLLAGIGAALRSSVRAVDAAARVGGDEFVVLLPETEAAAATELLGRLRTRLEAGAARAGGVVSFSIGAVTFTTPPADVDTLVRRADDLMYAVKAAGRNGLRQETVAGDQA